MQKEKYLIYNKQANYTSVCLKQPLLKDLFDLFLFFLTTPSIVYCGISQFVIYFFQGGGKTQTKELPQI